MLCNKCYAKMLHIMRFEKGKATEFDRCPKCFYETRPQTIKFDSFKTKTEKENTHKSCLPKPKRDKDTKKRMIKKRK